MVCKLAKLIKTVNELGYRKSTLTEVNERVCKSVSLRVRNELLPETKKEFVPAEGENIKASPNGSPPVQRSSIQLLRGHLSLLN